MSVSDQVRKQYADHVNLPLAKLMEFAGFGVESHSEGMYIWDTEGNKFLDCLGGYGVFSLGHRHPKVVEAVKAQLEKMPLSGKTFFNPKQAELATKLAEVSPEGLTYTFFSNSGAEAVEAAIKFARASTGRTGLVATENGYHGKTMGGLSITGREKFRKRYEPLIPGVTFVSFGDAEAARAAIGPDTAAMFIETVQGEGGVYVPPVGYLQELRKACDSAGALLVVDEVQTGLGRTGKMFGSDHEGVRPDIMPLAKALGGGVMPIGATMATSEVFDRVYGDTPLTHTSTFGGNPLACAAGLAAIQVVQEEGLAERAAEMGGYMMEALRSRLAGEELVTEVRGQGLLIGVEFAMDEVGELTIAQIVKRGMVAAYTLNNPRVIRIEPPLIIQRHEAERAVDIFCEAVHETSELLAALAI